MQVPDISIPGSIIHLDNQVAIVQIPMIGSCAIPLKIRHPKSIDLFTWSFTGFSGRNIADPSCILFLATQERDAFSNLSSVSLLTHAGDRRIILNPIFASVSIDKIYIAAMAFVSALETNNVTRFDALMPIIKPGLDVILAKTETGDLDIRRGDNADTWLVNNIDFIPDCMIVRSPAGYACSSLSAVRFQASRQAAVALTTAITLNAHCADGAILSGNGRYVAARVIEAM